MASVWDALSTSMVRLTLWAMATPDRAVMPSRPAAMPPSARLVASFTVGTSSLFAAPCGFTWHAAGHGVRALISTLSSAKPGTGVKVNSMV